jgi:zinc protease
MIRFLILFLTLAFACKSFAATTTEYRLSNGLKLVVKEDHRAPVVISQVWYKVGSSNEPGGITGISHALEHMMFRGTKQYGAGELDRIIAENGGQQNAFTNYDFTGYFQILAADKLAISFELEADRMRNLLLRAEDFKKEIQVVMEERRMRTEDNPQSQTYERFLAAANIVEPYHHPVIGWMNDLQNMTVEDVQQWYQRWYAPNNAIVVVVGDVQPQQVYQLAEKYFGPLKPSQLPKIKPQQEIKSLGERAVTVRLPAKLSWLVLGYNVPVIKTAQQSWEPYALEVLAAVLDGGNSARFAQHLVRGQQIAANTNVSYNLYSRFNNLFTLAATPTQESTLEKLQMGLVEQIKQVQTVLVGPQELQRVKTQLIASKIYQKDSLSEQANEIGGLMAVDLPWQLADEYITRISSITPQQIQMVAKKYLLTENLTVAKLIPLKTELEKAN